MATILNVSFKSNKMKTLAAVLIATFSLAGLSTQAQAKKKITKPAPVKRSVTETEAKDIHEKQMQSEGRTDERSAYKRSDFEPTQAPADPIPEPVTDKQFSTFERSVINAKPVMEKKEAGTPSEQPVAKKKKDKPKLKIVMPSKQTETAARQPREPVFLENIVLERTN
jgi:hypothetical protein